MSSLQIPDLAIGLICVYFFLRILTSAAEELLFSILTATRQPAKWLIRVFDLTALSFSAIPLTNTHGTTDQPGRGNYESMYGDGLIKKTKINCLH